MNPQAFRAGPGRVGVVVLRRLDAQGHRFFRCVPEIGGRHRLLGFSAEILLAKINQPINFSGPGQRVDAVCLGGIATAGAGEVVTGVARGGHSVEIQAPSARHNTVVAAIGKQRRHARSRRRQ